MKKVAFDNLEVGKEYFTVCGIWHSVTTYVGCEKVGSRIKYLFTYGQADNWENQLCHFCTKSNIKVYEKED